MAEIKKVATCRGCGAEIVWLKTQKGKNMPVDAETVTDGDAIYDRNIHTSHFDTCTNARPFRRKSS